MATLLSNLGHRVEMVGGKAYGQFPLGYGMWSRYLDAFDEVLVFTRGYPVETVSPGWKEETGPGVRVYGIPEWAGWRFPLAVGGLFIRAFIAVAQADAVLLQAPAVEAVPLSLAAWILGKPFGVYLRGEHGLLMEYMRDIRKNKAAALIVGAFRTIFVWQRRRAVIGVYESKYLQDRYPLPAGRPTEVLSSVVLTEEFFHEPRKYSADAAERVIITVARLNPEKGIDQLIHACNNLSARGVKNWRLRIFGDGPERENLQRLVKELGLSERVELPGWVAWGQDLIGELRRADLFVLNSLPAEGLPRAILEAMAVGLACISTRIAGAPEVLHPEDIAEPGDTEGLSDLMARVLLDPERLNAMAERNRGVAETFRLESFHDREVRLFQVLRQAAEKHK